MKTLCIYHAKCADGFGAAWVVHKALGDDVEFHAAHHGTPAPAVIGLDVVIVDFSYPADVILQLAQQARSVLIIDHHKTAAEALAQLPAAPANYAAWLDSQQPLGTVFDMNRSGAGLTWDFFNPGQPRPGLINHIEDRDLWRFALPNTREIQTALFSLPYSFELWSSFMDHPHTLIHDGIAIERKHHKDVAELVEASQRRMVIAGIDVPVANLPYTLSSDAGHLMNQGEPFAACYMDTPRGRVFSLRSAPDGLDVSAIAKQYGGGGHKNAAGFTVPFDHELVTGAFEPVAICGACGEAYPHPDSGALSNHIRVCSNHPMRELEQSQARLRQALAGLLGESTPQGLDQLEAGLRLVPMPAREKDNMISAIHALRDCSVAPVEAEVQP